MKRDPNVRPAFSLIELLVVILIIALVVAILLPALGHVRAKSRDAATRNLMQNLSQAIANFELENRHLPGVFPERDLGSGVNGQGNRLGLTSMENVLLDLCGGPVPVGTTLAGSFKIGPYADVNKNVEFHPDLVGTKKYFTPLPQYYKLQNDTEGGLKIASDSTPALNMGIRDLVDAEGMPIIAWMSDEATVGPITAISDLARVAPTPTASARFYLNSNYAFLGAARLGKKGVDQNDVDKGSLLGFGDSANASVSLAAMLGSPGSPKDISADTAGILPTAPRGSFVIHSAGRNGVFMGRTERGGGAAELVAGRNLFYGMNFKTPANAPLVDSNGRETSEDIMKGFDDILVAGGG
jgi:prepilin-type N-terminal cleavage/methylation domain-containing protein